MASGLVPGLVGTAITFTGLIGLYRGRGSAHWTPVAGTVLPVEIEERRPELDSRAVRYVATLHYRYAFNGQQHQGRRALAGAATSREHAVKLGQPYVSGQSIDVFIDVRRPQRHTLYRGEHRQFWWLIAFGLCWLSCALWLTLK